MVFFLNCYQITIEKLFAKITTVYKNPQGIFVEIDPGKPGNLREFCVGNWVDTLILHVTRYALRITLHCIIYSNCFV